MAAKKPKKDTAALAADEGVSIPRMSLGETGFTGLRTVNGRILEECNRAFSFPYFFHTIEEMRKTSLIASALSVYKMLISRVEWTVEPPVGATEVDKERAKFIESLKDDMENSWGDFIADVIEYLPYGYSVQEKVYRRRLTKNGSRYNDGKVGLKRISPRAQETIEKWEFSEDGRELLGVYQSIARMENSHLFLKATNTEGFIRIPREKFMLFSADGTRGNPLGVSILRGVFLSWKQMTMLKDKELLSIAKDSSGLPLIRMPAAFMSPDAPPDQKAVYEGCKKVLSDLANGTSDGIIFPVHIDQETKKDMFDVDYLDSKASNASNTDQVIRRYQDEILSALAVDILKTGTNEGVFSLADSNTNVLVLAVAHRLNEIANVLNNDLIPQVFRLNGWNLENLPKFVPGDVTSMSADELGKLAQRTGSIGLWVKDIATINRLRRAAGIPELPDDTDVESLTFTMESSNAGEGQQTPFDGTAKNPNGKDQSANNSENAA